MKGLCLDFHAQNICPLPHLSPGPETNREHGGRHTNGENGYHIFYGPPEQKGGFESTMSCCTAWKLLKKERSGWMLQLLFEHMVTVHANMDKHSYQITSLLYCGLQSAFHTQCAMCNVNTVLRKSTNSAQGMYKAFRNKKQIGSCSDHENSTAEFLRCVVVHFFFFFTVKAKSYFRSHK